MADRRTTDLLPGHIGESSYDIHQNAWSFSKNLTTNKVFQQILPFSLCVSPSIRGLPEQPTNSAVPKQSRWLSKTLPETVPANLIANVLAALQPTQEANSSTLGPLLAVGKALDADHTAGSRTAQVIAMSSGEAGHVLKIIKPRIEKQGWDRRDGVRISTLSFESAEQGHWIGTGGTIQQIVFANSDDGPDTWLAIRQPTTITIFRPAYLASPKPFVSSAAFPANFPPSRIDPNRVAVLTNEPSGSVHVDVAFNPWYPRQFGVVDDCGSWCLWDIEGRQIKQKLLKLVPGKSGHIHGEESSAFPPRSSQMDDWRRLLWVSNVSTIVVADRRRLSVFDLKSLPRRLISPDFMAATPLDWILDIKRSVLDLRHLFVLTTSRIFWIEVIAAGEDESGDYGARTLLSYRHFRDIDDETMKLEVFKDGDTSVVLVFSSKSLLTNSYVFLRKEGSPIGLQVSTDSTVSPDHQQNKVSTLSVVPVPWIASKSPGGGTGFEYRERGIKFYQTLSLTSDLGLHSTLSALRSHVGDRKPSRPIAPNTKSIQASIPLGPRRIHDESFIVPDEIDNEMAFAQTSRGGNARKVKRKDDLKLRVNYRKIFQKAFLEVGDEVATVSPLLQSIQAQIDAGKLAGSLPTATCFEMTNKPMISDDLDDSAQTIHEFLQSFDLHEDQESSSHLVLSDVTLFPATQFSEGSPRKPPRLLEVYDQLIDNFVTNLPLRTPGPTRLIKSQVVQRVATELCLSSVAVSFRHKLTPAAPDVDDSDPRPIRDTDQLSRASSPFYSSQIPQSSVTDAQHSLPTPESSHYAGSQYAASSAASALDLSEDAIITRLLQYTSHININTEVANAKSSVISHWPSTPGVNPATYSWTATRRSNMEQSEIDAEAKEKRKKIRAQEKRAREALKAQRDQNAPRTQDAEASTRPAPRAFGSQPVLAPADFSSQPGMEFPMTQPVGGVFGSRTAPQAKRKKRRAAGF